MDTMLLKENERIDDLLTNNLKIIQSDEVFSFSLDAVLLARFCHVPKRGKVLDLCTGNGVIPILLSTRCEGQIVGVEIQPRLCDMALRSVQLNGLESSITIVCDDARRVHERFGHGAFDHVTINPPYLPATGRDKNINPYIANARHELNGTLDELVNACARLVKSGGKVSMVHRPARLTEIIETMRKYRLEPKRMRFVHPRLDEEANIVLIEAIKDGGVELRLLPPMIVFEEGQTYTPELQQIFYGRKARDESYARTKKL